MHVGHPPRCPPAREASWRHLCAMDMWDGAGGWDMHTQNRWSWLLRPSTARDIGGQAATPDIPLPSVCSVSSFQRTRLSSISAHLSRCFFSRLSCMRPCLPRPLCRMINDPKSTQFIAWTELGTSFVVSNVGEFSRSILGGHFKHNNVRADSTTHHYRLADRAGSVLELRAAAEHVRVPQDQPGTRA